METLYYASDGKCDPAASFEVVKCGYDTPDPDYHFERYRQGNGLKYVSVFEYVISGKGHIECDGQVYTVEAGDFFFLDSKHTHRYYSDKENPFEKIWITTRGRLTAAALAAYYFSEPVVIKKIDVSDLFFKIADRLSSLNDSNQDDVFMDVAVMVTNIIVKVGTAIKKDIVPTGIAFRVKELIDSAPYYDITLSDIESKIFLSKSYIISLFSAQYNITPKQYILTKKIDLAKIYLKKSHYELSEIAQTLKFSSVQHFSSTFKRFTGFTPDSFRRS